MTIRRMSTDFPPPNDEDGIQLWRQFHKAKNSNRVINSSSIIGSSDSRIIKFPYTFMRHKNNKEWLRAWIKLYENYP